MCTNINIEWLKNNRDQLIAEAFEVYKNGQEDLHLTDPEVLAIAKQHQDDRQAEDAWIQHVREYMEKLAPGAGFTISDVADIAVGVKKDKLDKSVQIRLGQILKKLCIPSKRVGHDHLRMYYPIKEHKEDQIVPENNW